MAVKDHRGSIRYIVLLNPGPLLDRTAKSSKADPTVSNSSAWLLKHRHSHYLQGQMESDTKVQKYVQEFSAHEERGPQ